MKTAKRLEGIGEYYFSKKLREIELLNQQGKQVINLGIGSPDQPPHPDVIATLQAEAAKPNQHGYQSYKGSPVLRKAIADWYAKWYHVELDPEHEILPLIGSKEGIMHICMTYLDKHDEVLLPDPGYPTYHAAVMLAGAKPVTYELKASNQYQPGFTKIEKKKLGRVKLMFVNYPHMPTGQVATTTAWKELIAFAKRHDILIIHDNPYSFILNDAPASLLAVDGAKDCVIELNSLSKSHNMAGWRVGMLCGKKEFVDDVLRFKSNMDSGMFLPLQLAAAKALTLGQEWIDSVNTIYHQRREIVFQLLDQLGCSYSKNQSGLFVWAKTPGSHGDGFALSDHLLHEASVFITPGGIFGKGGKKFIRVSLCASAEKLHEALQRISIVK